MGEKSEALALIARFVTALRAAPADASTNEAATLRRVLGELETSAEALIAAATLGQTLQSCTASARMAAVTQAGLARVRQDAEVQAPLYPFGGAVRIAIIRLCLCEEAKILSATEYASQDEVGEVMARMHVAFEGAEQAAADGAYADATVYRSLIVLHAAVTRDLGVRGQVLPRVVAFDFGDSLPSITIANRLYGDAARGEEIAAGNRVFHPLFVPRDVRALSV